MESQEEPFINTTRIYTPLANPSCYRISLVNTLPPSIPDPIQQLQPAAAVELDSCWKPQSSDDGGFMW